MGATQGVAHSIGRLRLTRSAQTMELGQNITATIEGDKLTLVIDLGTTIGVSRSGKSIVIATTSGNQMLPGGVVIGVNVYRKQQRQDRGAGA